VNWIQQGETKSDAVISGHLILEMETHLVAGRSGAAKSFPAERTYLTEKRKIRSSVISKIPIIARMVVFA